jgi:hypothetical protein
MDKDYKIVMVERWTFLNQQRNPTDGYRVTFEIPGHGITDHVIMAVAAYNPDNVRKAIEDKVEQHLALLS